jgi:hypothetical protein
LKHAEQLSERVIAGTLQISHGVVNAYLQRARHASLAWPLPEGLDDDGLELLLFRKLCFGVEYSTPKHKKCAQWATVGCLLGRVITRR